MLLSFLIRGILMGVAIAAPVGPIALLCIRRTLASGRWVGLVSGCGAATADGFYGAIAAFGLTAISNVLVSKSFYLRIVGGLFLCYLGAKTFLDNSTIDTSNDLGAPVQSDLTQSGLTQSDLTQSDLTQSDSIRSGSIRSGSIRSGLTLANAYMSTFVLTLTNPATILSFMAIFAGLGITQTQRIASVTLVFGVFTGSLLWWLVLTAGVTYVRSRITAKKLARFNQVSSKVFGGLIFGFGLVALLLR